VDLELDKKPLIKENELFTQSKKDDLIDPNIGSTSKSYVYRKEGNFINIYNKSNNTFKLKISIDAFKNKKGGLYRCDCGMNFFSVTDLLKHIVQKSKCLNHYITYKQEIPKVPPKEKIPSKSDSLKKKEQKAKFLYVNKDYVKLENSNFVIDGANVAREGTEGMNGGKISNFHKLFDKLSNLQINNYVIICDRSLNYTIDNPSDYSELIREGKIIETPGGTEADHFILKFAKDHDAFIISNDLFKEFEPIFGKEWIRSKRISFKIIKDKLYLDKIYLSS
jgi:hypothetical protein